MKAITITDDNQLIWQNTPNPLDTTPLQPHQVAINVKATAVNRADLMQRKGVYPAPPGASNILGLECAGEISAVGTDVNQWKIGDKVCALLAGGGYAETVVCAASHILPIPNGFSFEQAAALPEVFATAWLNIFMEANLQPNESVLCHAGASGVGTAAIQLCHQFGHNCYVTVGSNEKLEFCRSLGATNGINRHNDNIQEHIKTWTQGKGVNVILDPVGGDSFENNIRCLNTDGRMIMIGIMAGRKSTIDLGRLLVKRLSVVGSTLRSRNDEYKSLLIAELSEKVWPLFETGKLKPIIDTQLPITEAEQAFTLIESNKTTGKVILSIN
ncbi:NAD(P)H-quinone oxidoreductase [Gammaproteobacteria bacterium 42_54_T18]|nr:NAD(P)H-quinone oxidoreductase [Gammaproteobacteria bacterium 42_54_T18]